MSTRTNESAYTRVVDNFLLLWLDENIDEINNQDCRNTIKTLQQVVNTIHVFTDVDECLDFITDTTKDKVFIIVSETLSQIIVPVVQHISPVNSVYILHHDKDRYEKDSAQQSYKVKGAFKDIIPLCEALKQNAYECDRNSISISFVDATDGVSNKSLDELDQSFMYTQILKEILLTIDFQQIHISEFLAYCRSQFVGNISRLKDVDKLENEYRDHQPIWWYTSGSFLYSMLNKALRTMEVDIIIQIGFFISALHQNIAQLHSEQYGGQNPLESFTVFRGQGLSQADFDKLIKTTGGLISFNNFLSTSLDKDVSTMFAESNQSDPNLIGVLFEITVDPSISSTPFSKVTDDSYYENEGEILFSMHSVFRIGQAKQIDGNNRLWQVDLTLTTDSDPQLHALTEYIREETFPGQEGWYRLGRLLIKLGEFDKAEKLYNVLLNQASDASWIARIYFQLGWIKDNQGEYEAAIAWYRKLLEMNDSIPQGHSLLAHCYNNVGIAYNKMGEYPKSISFHEKALEIRQKLLPSKDPSLATSYNNIANMHANIGEYSKALLCNEKALEIWQECLPSTHPDLATSHNNIGVLYINSNEFSKALWYLHRALAIRQKALPLNHPDLADSYNNIGVVYGNMGEYSKAASFFEEALKIIQKTLSQNHPKVATFYNNIASMHENAGEYWKAIYYFQIACEIQKRTLPPNHPYFGATYSNIGNVYCKIGKGLKGISCLEKALKIFQNALPPNHPNFVTSYSSIGMVYSMMGNHSKALWYYEKVFEICEKILPSNHFHLVTIYNNVGGVYENMGNHLKALSFFKRALEIGQHSLPENHPTLRMVQRNIDRIRMNL